MFTFATDDQGKAPLFFIIIEFDITISFAHIFYTVLLSISNIRARFLQRKICTDKICLRNGCSILMNNSICLGANIYKYFIYK